MKPEVIIAAVVGAVLGAAAMFGYRDATAEMPPCEAYYNLAAPMTGQTFVGRTTSAGGVLNPGIETSYIGSIVLAGTSGEGNRVAQLRSLYDRCIDSVD